MKKLIAGVVAFLTLLLPFTAFAATTFLEPGGDATGNALLTSSGGFWRAVNGTPAVATDFVHGTHVDSIKFRPAQADAVKSPLSIVQDAGSRTDFWIYLNALPSSTVSFFSLRDGTGLMIVGLYLTNAGVLIMQNATPSQLGSNGPTLSTGQWYRISLVYGITSTSVNNFTVYVNGVSAIAVTNGSIGTTGSTALWWGNINTNSTLDLRLSDVYADNSASGTDPGNIWVTAKRPFANGTTNGFTSQIGASGSGYGSGHAPQVNERPLSTTNGWSMVGSGSATTEEYSIEGLSVGDFNLTGASIIDSEGWAYAGSLAGETASIIVGGTTSNIALTSSNTMFSKVKGSTSYPAGSTDVGVITTTALTTVSLYEAGIMVAFIPGSTTISKPVMNLFAYWW